MTNAQVILAVLVLGALLALWQFRVVPLFCRVRPVPAGESVDFPLSER
jgi:hypothetical protein